jgi:Kef-type K+ transport system membrane component KefB
VIGLVVAGVFVEDRVIVDRLRTIAFALLTPFFFLRAGLLISFPALLSGAGVIALLFLVKMVTKGVAVWPTTAMFGFSVRDRAYTTLLMATGLTFGSIAALYGLSHGLISQEQYSQLVTVVILSALVPTIIAQQYFEPDVEDLLGVNETSGEEDFTSFGHLSRRGDGSRSLGGDSGFASERE